MAIKFPDIDPVAFSLGPVDVRWYALAYLAGFILGWQYVLYLSGLDKSRKRDGVLVNKTDIDDFLPWLILSVILGGRFGYVLFYQFEMYIAEPWEIAKVWHGGMSFHGGALGAIVAMVAFSFRRKIPLLRLTDLVCCAVPIGLFFGRIANFINGELFGRVAALPWSVRFPNGGEFSRHPSQLYEAALEGIVLFAVLATLVHLPSVRKKAGILSGTFLIGYGLARIFVEFFREPDLQIGLLFDYFTMGQLLSLPMILFGMGLIGLAFRKRDEEVRDDGL